MATSMAFASGYAYVPPVIRGMWILAAFLTTAHSNEILGQQFGITLAGTPVFCTDGRGQPVAHILQTSHDLITSAVIGGRPTMIVSPATFSLPRNIQLLVYGEACAKWILGYVYTPPRDRGAAETQATCWAIQTALSQRLFNYSDIPVLKDELLSLDPNSSSMSSRIREIDRCAASFAGNSGSSNVPQARALDNSRPRVNQDVCPTECNAAYRACIPRCADADFDACMARCDSARRSCSPNCR